jgi:hypothetical protein
MDNPFTQYRNVDEYLWEARHQYDRQVKRIKEMAWALDKAREVAARFDTPLVPETAFGCKTLPNPRLVTVFETEIVLDVRVYRFADVLPVLEALEDELGVFFRDTHDAAEFGFRRYNGAGNGVVIEVRGNPDLEHGAVCRQVPTGEKKDIYKLECN